MNSSSPDYQLVWPFDLPANHGSLHWRVRYEQRKRACRVFGDLLPQLRARSRATVTWVRVLGPKQREMDESNFCLLTKGIEDALTHCGYIVDDKPSWIDRQHHIDDGTRRHLGPRLEILITYERKDTLHAPVD